MKSRIGTSTDQTVARSRFSHPDDRDRSDVERRGRVRKTFTIASLFREAPPRDARRAATFGEREKALNVGSRSCIACPILLMDRPLAWRSFPVSSSNAFG